ncbi:SPOR domain-containing protein [Micromonospora sp. NBC_00421]|uniref:SPOR domain-containing protein n=1 Tax=Micromonospora sp. NBC_00421 TaxID=2975976 RepID=UPI002E1DE294
MSARRLLLPAAAVLFALTACNATEAPSSGSTAGAPGATPTATTQAPGDVNSADCPSGTNLQKLVELPKGVTFGGVECVKDWAGADPQGPGVGDGVYLFHYTAGTGWKYYGEGSGQECKELGLTEPAPFCVSDPATTATKPATKPAATKPATTSPKCPSAKALESLVELPKGMTFGGVECVKDWAGADPQGPKAGDGVYLFHYTAGTGWKYYGEGSGYDCKDLGLTEPAPFCIS